MITSAGQALGANVPDDEDHGALKPLPERLVMELTAHRTLALREAVGRSPDVALTLLLLKLVNDTFRTSSSAGSCLEASVRQVYMSAQASDLKDSVVAKLVDDRHAEWEANLPLGDDAVMWDYLTSLDQASRLSLLAHCLSFGINALLEKVNPYGAGISASGLTKRMTQSDLVAQATGLDMVEAGWEPTADTYLNRVPKVRILETAAGCRRFFAVTIWQHAAVRKGRGRLSPFPRPSRPKMSTLPLSSPRACRAMMRRWWLRSDPRHPRAGKPALNHIKNSNINMMNAK